MVDQMNLGASPNWNSGIMERWNNGYKGILNLIIEGEAAKGYR